MRILRLIAALGVAAGLTAAWTVFGLDKGPGAAGSPTGSRSGTVTYYVQPGGHDSAAGTSPVTAWRTLARASRAHLVPGDRLMLLGGRSYHGPLTLGPGDGGSSRKPVLISSYGGGTATIVSATSGIVIFDTAGFKISNIVMTGQNAMRAGGAGVLLYSDRSAGMLDGVWISSVKASQFQFGVAIGAEHDGAGFRNVHISHSLFDANLDGGLVSYGPDFNPASPGYAHEGIYVTNVSAFDNKGDPADHIHNSGSGIQLGSVNGAEITHSVAYDNGGVGGAKQEGPIGIWAYDSNRVTIAHDVSYSNSSASVYDGGGFGLDRETFRSVMEYNLSYDNHGAGFLLYSAFNSPGPQRDNVVRFNISYGDARGTKYLIGGISAGGSVIGGLFYQNTVVMTGNSQPAVRLGGVLRHFRVLNNILISAAGPVVQALQPMKAADVLFAGNDYVSAARPWSVRWGPVSYDSLSAWRAGTSEEKVRGKLTGFAVLPQFAGLFSPGHPHSVLMLRLRSPLRNAGLDLRLLFGIAPGPVAYRGTPYSVKFPNIGAQ